MTQKSILALVNNFNRQIDYLLGTIQQLKKNNITYPNQSNNAGKVLSTDGTNVEWVEPTAGVTEDHTHLATDITQDSTHRFVTDVEKTAWNAKQAAGDYATNTVLTNAVNLKQATLVSGTNIKTINDESLLGSGNITITGGETSIYKNFTDVGYSATLSIAFDEDTPNINITDLAGNLNLSITGTVEGDSGLVVIPLTAGSEIITLNGTVVLSNFPSGASATIRLGYIHEPTGLKWFCTNPFLITKAEYEDILDRLTALEA